jgi:putative FmdB family regulatory protein
MPVYEYRCLTCGKTFELLIRGEAIAACPACETSQVERRMSLPARPAGGKSPDFSKLGPPAGSGGCGSGSCGCH